MLCFLCVIFEFFFSIFFVVVFLTFYFFSLFEKKIILFIACIFFYAFPVSERYKHNNIYIHMYGMYDIYSSQQKPKITLKLLQINS